MASNIPYARELVETAIFFMDDDHGRDILREALDNMTRKSPARRAPRKNTMDASKVAAIRETAAQYPHMSFQDIAVHVGVNAGRVSEVLNP